MLSVTRRIASAPFRVCRVHGTASPSGDILRSAACRVHRVRRSRFCVRGMQTDGMSSSVGRYPAEPSMHPFFSRNRRSVSDFRFTGTGTIDRTDAAVCLVPAQVFLSSCRISFRASRGDIPASIFFLYCRRLLPPCRKRHETYEGKQKICRCLRSFHYMPCGTFVFGGKRVFSNIFEIQFLSSFQNLKGGNLSYKHYAFLALFGCSLSA